MMDDALILFEEISSSIKDEVLKSSVFNEIGNIYLNKNELDKALDYFDMAADGQSTNSFKAQYMLNIAKTYKLKENYISSKNKIDEILAMEDLKYNLKNEAQQMKGELDFLNSK